MPLLIPWVPVNSENLIVKGKNNIKEKLRTHRRENYFLLKIYVQSRNYSLFEPKNLRNKIVMCFSFIGIENISKYTYKEQHFFLFIYLCFLEEKESKRFLRGCDQNKALRVGFMLDHISRFFHSRMKPGLRSVPLCRKPSSLLSVPCAAFSWFPALAQVALQSSFPLQKQRPAGVPFSTEETQRASQA